MDLTDYGSEPAEIYAMAREAEAVRPFTVLIKVNYQEMVLGLDAIDDIDQVATEVAYVEQAANMLTGAYPDAEISVGFTSTGFGERLLDGGECGDQEHIEHLLDVIWDRGTFWNYKGGAK